MEKKIKEDDLAAIIYTSATTGTPKGVELTHKSLVRHLYDIPFELKAGVSRYLSILPLAHIFGHSLNLIAFAWGASIYYSNDIKNLGAVFQQIHPTITVVVPRLLEKVYMKMQAAVQASGFMKRHIGQWAFDLANQEEDSLLKHLAHPIVDKIVYSHLRASLGGCLEAVISGGAPLNPHLNKFYQEIGVPIFEGWGLTEACPITVNFLGANKLGTVGKPFKGVELKISPQGEVLVRGSLTMNGYFKNPEASARALDEEGWLHTGDKGEIDQEGYLKLHGRLKEIFKTSTGEWVAPVPIEQIICQAPLIEMAMVIAEGKKFVSCLLFPNKDVLNHLKAAHNASEVSDEEFLNSEFVREEMDRLFEKINLHLNHWEQIRAYRFISHPPSIEAGEMTPSMKLRRDVIMKKYRHQIDAMYPQEATL
jgi:long-chain acyl-CoA synthetase